MLRQWRLICEKTYPGDVQSDLRIIPVPFKLPAFKDHIIKTYEEMGWEVTVETQ